MALWVLKKDPEEMLVKRAFRKYRQVLHSLDKIMDSSQTDSRERERKLI